MSTILVVCTGNICRSPVGAAVLTALLPAAFRITSAGTHAAVGQPATPEAVQFVRREVGTEIQHVAQQLTRDQLEAADLIITMTLEHRAWVARTAPRAVRRAFTLRELAVIVNYPEFLAGRETVRDLALTASTFRSQAGIEGEELDIEDPYGGSPMGYETAFGLILAASRAVGGAMAHRSAEDPDPGPVRSRKVIPLRGLPDPQSLS